MRERILSGKGFAERFPPLAKLSQKGQDKMRRKSNSDRGSRPVALTRDETVLNMIMKLLTYSRHNPNRLMVPIHEFEVTSFPVLVRHLGPRRSTAPQSLLRISQKRPKNVWSPPQLAAAG